MPFSMQQIDRIRGARVNLSIGHRTVFGNRASFCHWLFAPSPLVLCQTSSIIEGFTRRAYSSAVRAGDS
jgi:hypothetical protein